MDSHIRIRLGGVEVEYEGSEDFIKNDLMDFLGKTIDVSMKARTAGLMKEESEQTTTPETFKKIELSTNSITSKINATSSKDRAIAAAAHLTLVEGKDSFSRKELLQDMQSATQYYKKSDRSNLTQTLKRLVELEDLRELKTDTYALSADKKEKLERIIVG